ncbi:MAG TPA: L,D-transpeptidase family protein [Blastocatellia bacterium]|nr:L,D-transpeptidase family protein [Blastocatellia bacterium]
MNVFRLLPVGLALSLAITFSFAQQKKKMNDKSPQTPLAESRQLVVVVTPDWNAVDGRLWRFERHSTKDAWQQIESGIPVVVGKNGLAWGSGLHAPQSGSGLVKKEGDGKSPAGIFRLSSAFGYASAAEAGAIKLPYTHLTGTIECVDDVKSAHYNTILDRSRASVDWNSSEKMREQKDYYRWGVVVDHNAAPVRKGGGSCIFLHIWNRAGSGTAGCTAMKAAPMEELLRWLDPAARPLLVQLPEAEYERLKVKWQLPERK